MKILVGLLQLFSLASFGQKLNYDPFDNKFSESPSIRLELYGKVKSIRFTDYYYSIDPNTKQVKTEYIDGTWAGSQCFFDEKRRIIRKIIYREDGSVQSDFSYYNYDEFIMKAGVWHHLNIKQTSELDTVNKIIKTKKFRKGVLEVEEIIRYTGDFKPLENTIFEKGKQITKYKWVYDKKGRVISSAYKGIYMSQGGITKYDGDKLVERRSYGIIPDVDNFTSSPPHLHMIVKYEGPIITGTHRFYQTVNGKSTLVSETIVTYADPYRILKRVTKEYIDEYRYNNAGQEIEYTARFKNGGAVITHRTKSYNKEGDVVESISDKNENSVTKYVYKYDKMNNWIECQVYENNLLTEKRLRQIEYY